MTSINSNLPKRFPNKPGTAQVGAPVKAQKFNRGRDVLCWKSKKNDIRKKVKKSSIVEKIKGWTFQTCKDCYFTLKEKELKENLKTEKETFGAKTEISKEVSQYQKTHKWDPQYASTSFWYGFGSP